MDKDGHAIADAGLTTQLLRATEAWRNWRALLTLAATGVLFVLLAGTSAAGAGRGQFFLFVVGNLLGLMVLLTGFSTAGVLLMDQARGCPSRKLNAALADGANCALRYVVMAFGALVLTALYTLLVAMLLFVARIPGLGALLYLLLFPLLTLCSTGVFVLYYFVFMLLGPALWSGATLQQAAARLYGLGLCKPVQAVVACLLLSLLVGLLAVLLGGATTAGTLFVSGLSVPILGEPDEFGGMLGPHRHGMMNGMAAIGWAGLVGSGIVYALVGAAVAAAMILGLCQVWSHLTADMDFATVEHAFDERMKGARDSAIQLRRDALERARKARDALRSDDATTVPTDKAAAPACPKCGAATHAGDVFCSECGTRLADPPQP